MLSLNKPIEMVERTALHTLLFISPRTYLRHLFHIYYRCYRNYAACMEKKRKPSKWFFVHCLYLKIISNLRAVVIPDLNQTWTLDSLMLITVDIMTSQTNLWLFFLNVDNGFLNSMTFSTQCCKTTDVI